MLIGGRNTGKGLYLGLALEKTFSWGRGGVLRQYGRKIGSFIWIGPFCFGKFRNAQTEGTKGSIWQRDHPDYHRNMSEHTQKVIGQMFGYTGGFPPRDLPKQPD